MSSHFEDLWEQCENFHKDNSGEAGVQNAIESLSLKINLYKALDSQKEISGDEMQKMKSRVLGEIILAITCLSYKDNINVFEALGLALQYRNIELMDKKYPI